MKLSEDEIAFALERLRHALGRRGEVRVELFGVEWKVLKHPYLPGWARGLHLLRCSTRGESVKAEIQRLEDYLRSTHEPSLQTSVRNAFEVMHAKHRSAR